MILKLKTDPESILCTLAPPDLRALIQIHFLIFTIDIWSSSSSFSDKPACSGPLNLNSSSTILKPCWPAGWRWWWPAPGCGWAYGWGTGGSTEVDKSLENQSISFHFFDKCIKEMFITNFVDVVYASLTEYAKPKEVNVLAMEWWL